MFFIESKTSLKKILLQLTRFSPKDVIPYFIGNSSNISLMNGIFTLDDIDQKILVHLAMMIMTEVVKYQNSIKKFYLIILEILKLVLIFKK